MDTDVSLLIQVRPERFFGFGRLVNARIIVQSSGRGTASRHDWQGFPELDSSKWDEWLGYSGLPMRGEKGVYIALHELW